MAKSNNINYDDWALVMTAVISCIAILGLVFALKSGLTGNFFKSDDAKSLQIAQPSSKASPTFYCKDSDAFALWTRNAVDAVIRLDYSCTISDVNNDVTCCYAPKE